MCLSIPMRITHIDGFTAHCEAKGVTREVSLFLLQDDLPGVGDFVQVQVGYAQRRVAPEEAAQAWELLDQVLDALQGDACTPASAAEPE